jgi:hypothetical protein
MPKIIAFYLRILAHFAASWWHKKLATASTQVFEPEKNP